MPTVMIALNIFFAVLVVGGEVANILLGIATQHRFHDADASGSLLRRRVWKRPTRPHAGSVRPVLADDGQVWPAT